MKALHFIPAVFFLLVLQACEDKIELDLPEGEQFLIVQGWMTNEEGPQHINLYYTQPYFDASTPPPATGAIVRLHASTGESTLLEETLPGVYTYPNAGVVGTSYRLEITLADGTRYESTEEMLREPAIIEDIRWELSPRGPSDFFNQDPDQKYGVLIDTYEFPGLGDYYRWRLIVNGEERTRPIDLTIASDDFVDGNPIFNFEPFFELFFWADTVTIVQERISRGAYEFLLQVQAQTAFVGGPFDTPPTPITGNVRNLDDPKRNALGYFGAAGRDRATVVIGD